MDTCSKSLRTFTRGSIKRPTSGQWTSRQTRPHLKATEANLYFLKSCIFNPYYQNKLNK